MDEREHEVKLQILGESLIATYLAAYGFTIIKRNFHKLHAEIDIVAQYNAFIFAVEVRTRINTAEGQCDSLITIPQKKKATVMRSLTAFLRKNPRYERLVPAALFFIVTKNRRRIILQRIYD